jgi:hypothetical protein
MKIDIEKAKVHWEAELVWANHLEKNGVKIEGSLHDRENAARAGLALAKAWGLANRAADAVDSGTSFSLRHLRMQLSTIAARCGLGEVGKLLRIIGKNQL